MSAPNTPLLPETPLKPGVQSWLLLIATALIWGSSFILMKKGLEVFPPRQVATMRIFFTMLAMLPFLYRGIGKINKKNLLPIWVIAIAGSGFPPFLFTAAQTHLPSAAAGILNTFTPLFTLVVGVVVFNVVFEWRRLAGVLLGLAGAVLLVLTTAPNSGNGNANYFYGSYILLATLCYGISANTVKRHCQNLPATALNSLVFCFLGPFAGLYLLSTDVFTIVHTNPMAYRALGFIVILSVFNSALAGIFYFKLTQQTSALFASTSTYIVPFVAVLFGAYDGEAIGWSYAAGLLFILSGVYLASR